MSVHTGLYQKESGEGRHFLRRGQTSPGDVKRIHALLSNGENILDPHCNPKMSSLFIRPHRRSMKSSAGVEGRGAQDVRMV